MFSRHGTMLVSGQRNVKNSVKCLGGGEGGEVEK